MELSLELTKRYSYADYLTWIDDKRRELIDGFIHLMSPAPKWAHVRINDNIYFQLGLIVTRNHGQCVVCHAPIDVRFPKNGETTDDKIYTVVQPDICVICDLSKIDDLGCCGAPDMIVEVLSPSTAKKDMYDKFILYQEHGVKEYWVVHPKDKALTVFLLQEDGKYDAGTLYEFEKAGKKVPVHVFKDYMIDLNDIFNT